MRAIMQNNQETKIIHNPELYVRFVNYTIGAQIVLLACEIIAFMTDVKYEHFIIYNVCIIIGYPVEFYFTRKAKEMERLIEANDRSIRQKRWNWYRCDDKSTERDKKKLKAYLDNVVLAPQNKYTEEQEFDLFFNEIRK